MLVAWPYRRRGSFLEAFDPRARLLFALSLMLSTLFFWDVRVLAGLWALALLYFRLNRLTWRETRRAWLFTGFVAVVFVALTFLTGRSGCWPASPSPSRCSGGPRRCPSRWSGRSSR